MFRVFQILVSLALRTRTKRAATDETEIWIRGMDLKGQGERGGRERET